MPTLVKQWLEQGIEQGRRQERQELILHILRRRFKELPTTLEAMIGQLETEQLAELVDLALEATSLAPIEAFLTRHLPGKQSNGAT